MGMLLKRRYGEQGGETPRPALDNKPTEDAPKKRTRKAKAANNETAE